MCHVWEGEKCTQMSDLESRKKERRRKERRKERKKETQTGE